MTDIKNVPSKPLARERLQPSVLKLGQRELLGDDIDLGEFYLKFSDLSFDLGKATQDIQIVRTIEGASSIEVTVLDQDRLLLRSGRLAARADIKIDSLNFRLVGVRKSGKTLVLTFEDREVALLRTYKKPIKASGKTSRTKVTRAEFVLRMIREVKEDKLRYVIPELHVMQPIAKSSDISSSDGRVANRNLGIPKDNALLVKGHFMTENQRAVANKVLDTGASRLVKRQILVMSIMAAIQESTLSNLPGGDLDSKGVFQQRASQGWPASRDVVVDTGAFLDKLVDYESKHPQYAYWRLIADVQRPREEYRTRYADWRAEAEAIVLAYGVAEGDYESKNSQWTPTNSAGDYEFYRGVPPQSGEKKWDQEDSWTCIQRLADEVHWRAFFVSGTFYFLSESDLFKSQPVAQIDENTDGIDSIDGDYDEGKPIGEVTITCRAGRWAAPPGSVIQLVNMGPWNGRWLVNDIKRSLFKSNCTIRLKKPRPRLPEPKESNLPSDGTTWTGVAAADDRPKTFKVGTALVQPIPQGKSTPPGHGPVHPTLGLYTDGIRWPAIDFYANPGTAVLAVESGTIYRLSGHNPALGAIEGPGGPLGWSVYLKGDSGNRYYYTHLDKRFVSEKQKVAAGAEIATVADYDRFGRQSHVHLAIEPGGSIGIEVIGAAEQAVKS